MRTKFLTLIFLAVSLGTNAQKLLDSTCKEEAKYKGAVASGKSDCICKRPADAAKDGDEVCLAKAPANSVAFCENTSSTSSKCGFTCVTGFKLEGGLCVKDSGSSSGTGGGEEGKFPKDATPCPAHAPTLFASPNAVCACYRRGPPAALKDSSVQCSAPLSGNGKPKCVDISAKASECQIVCDTGYKLTADKKDCAKDSPAQTIAEEECSAANGGTYLIADPVKGCYCADKPAPGWCGVPTPDTAGMSCKHEEGKKNAQCFVTDCPPDHKAVGKECIPEIGKFRHVFTNSGECKDAKIYRLPGKKGCLCDNEEGGKVPAGAVRCSTPLPFTFWTHVDPALFSAEPANGYGGCLFRAPGTRDAVCTRDCNSGFYLNSETRECEE